MAIHLESLKTIVETCVAMHKCKSFELGSLKCTSIYINYSLEVERSVKIYGAIVASGKGRPHQYFPGVKLFFFFNPAKIFNK